MQDEEKHNAKTFVDDHVVSDDSATAYLYTPPTRDTRQVDGELHIPVTFQTLHPAQAHSDAEEQKCENRFNFCCVHRCDQRARAASAQSSQCGSIAAASNNIDHAPWALYCCLFAPHIYGWYASRTSPL